MVSLADICRSRYLLYRNLVDCGFPAAKASAAVDVLLDEECDVEAATFEPDEEDEADYREWGREVDGRWWSDRIDRDSFRHEGDDSTYLSDLDVMVATGCVG